MSRDEAVEALAPGTKVKLWVGMTLLGYPERGTIRQYLPDFPFGPTYEVEFPPNDFVPSACLKPEWLFPVLDDEAKDPATPDEP